MQSKSLVEIADQMSRKRAIIAAAAAAWFLAVQVIARPFFVGRADTAQHAKLDWWAINAVLLLLCLATGGGILNRPALRALVNDEVSRMHYKTAVITGYWVAMVVAMAAYFLASAWSLTAREAVYLTVTPSIGIALLVFSYLEYRAHRDA